MKLKGLRKLSSAVLVALMLLVTPVSLPATNPQVLANTVGTNTTLELPPKVEQLPARFNWADYGIVPEAKDQGSYGTCWSFGLTGALESAIALQFNEKVNLSEAWLVKATGKIVPGIITATAPCALRDEGMAINAGAEALIRAGEAFENCLPYQTTDMCCIGSSCSLPSCPVKYRAESFKKVALSDQTKEEIIKIKQALLEHGPLAMSYHPTLWAENATIIETNTATDPTHFVLLTGWDDSIWAWIVRNNYGTSFGQNGYNYIQYGKAGLVKEFAYLTATAFDPNDIVLAGDNGTAVGSESFGRSSAWMGMQWTVTTPIYLKSVEFWTATFNTEYTIYVAPGKITEAGEPVFSVSGMAPEIGYYSIPTNMLPLTPGYWNVQIKITLPDGGHIFPQTGDLKTYPNLKLQPDTVFIRRSENAPWEDTLNIGNSKPIRIRLNTTGAYPTLDHSPTPTPIPFPKPIPTPTVNLTVLVTPSQGGIVEINPSSPFKQGQRVQLTAKPNAGYHFVSWEDGSTNPVRILILNSSATVTARFEPDKPKEYKIVYSDNLGNSYTRIVEQGGTITIPLQRIDNWTLKSVLVNGQSIGLRGPLTLSNIQSDYSIVATYVLPHNISLQVGSKEMVHNLSSIQLDAPPIIVNDRTLVPLRAIAEAFNAQVNWNPDTKQVTVKIGDKTILLTIGNPKASVNGQPVYIDPQNPQVVPIISNSRTMVPLRFIAETMGATVEWNPVFKSIYISYEEEP